MERKAVSGMTLILLLISMLTLAFEVQPVQSEWAWTETIFIRADGSVDPDTAPISTVDNITYTLTDNVVGDVPYGTSAIFVERDNIVVDGADYTVQSTESGTGIDLSYRSNVTLKNVEIKNFGNYGIYLYHSSNNTLTSNTVLNNYEGICLSDSSNNNVISGNNISSNSNRGLYIYYDSNNNVISGNNVSDNMAGIQLQISSNNALNGNIVLGNYDGIRVESSSNNNIITGNIISSNQNRGINIHYSRDNAFAGNTASKNFYGIYVFYFSRDNTFFHNNLLDNTFQAYAEFWHVNTWDDGYPSGGNYWSDHVTVDDCCGVNQDEPGSDGIVDEPYIINADNRDNYPLVKPWSPVIPASVDIDPDTLNLRNMGTWITAYIQLPEGYNPEDIDATTMLLNETIPPVLDPKYDFVANSSEYLVDNNGDGILERMVKFDRAMVLELILAQGITNGYATLTITGRVNGTPFKGEDSIKVFLGGGGSGRRK